MKDVLFNKESELMIRLQGKGNRFVIVDTKTDNKVTKTNS